MKKKRVIIPLICIMWVIIIAGIFLLIEINKQPVIGIYSKNVIKVDGKNFKDLNNNGKLDKYEDWRLTSDERAEDLIAQMNLDEKVGMLYINTQTLGINQADKTKVSEDGILDESTTASSMNITMNKVGSTDTITKLNIRHIIYRTTDSAKDIAMWTNKLNEVAESTRLGIPVVVTSNPRNESTTTEYDFDVSQNKMTQYPGTLGIAAAALGNEKSDLIEEFAEIVREEWTAVGIRKGYMYQADVLTDARWGRNYQTFGENTELVSEIMTKLVKGIQGKDGLNSSGVALTVKHFPGSGARYNGYDSHYEVGKYSPYPTENSMANYHLKPFEAAINAGVSSIMPYYSLPDPTSAKQMYNGNEIKQDGSSYTYNSFYLQDLLQDYMNFKGYVNTDSGVIDWISWGEESATELERTAKAINSGCTLISDSNKVELLKEAVETGLVTEEVLNDRVKKVLVEMFDLGLFENPYVDVDEASEIVASEENLEKAYEAHLKSVTLLKNKDEVLPIKTSSKEKVYFTTMQKVDIGNAKKIREKLKADFENIEFVETVDEADYAVIYMIPVQNTLTDGEIKIKIDADTGINVREYQAMCDTIHNNGGKVITVVNVSSPWILTEVEPYCDALIAGYSTYIKAIFEVITGKEEPTGKLPVTLPASEAVIAVDEDGNCASPNDVPGYDKNKYMEDGLKYEYLDSEGNSYLLGFGLGY